MKVLVTGADGFIGSNVTTRLRELGDVVLPYVRGSSEDELARHLAAADGIVHLAGVNRPETADQFQLVNAGLTARLCDLLVALGRAVPLILASSIQAEGQSPYGKSKRDAEVAVQGLAEHSGHSVTIYRLPNVFGKWCRPNYNSVVATFCHNIARDLPIRVDDPSARLRLVHVDDVVDAMISTLRDPVPGMQWGRVEPEYETSVGATAATIQGYRDSRTSLMSSRVGQGLERALYSTYVSYLPVDSFAYPLARHEDPRGTFVEVLKTLDSGQFSYFTAHPGVTRGGHYHHTKTEKFVVIRGRARFRFRHVVTGDGHEIIVEGARPLVVETVPGWAHDITNVGADELIVMLWANEVFDRARPDTITSEL